MNMFLVRDIHKTRPLKEGDACEFFVKPASECVCCMLHISPPSVLILLRFFYFLGDTDGRVDQCHLEETHHREGGKFSLSVHKT